MPTQARWALLALMLVAATAPATATAQQSAPSSPVDSHAAAPVPTLPDSVRVGVEITGLEGDLQDNAEAVLTLKLQEGSDLSPGRARTLHKRAEEEIQAALAPFGRYQVEVEGDLTEAGGDWHAAYRVTPGPATLVERVDVVLTGEGAADSGFVAIVDSFPLVRGDTLRHALYEATKSELQRYALNYGYFAAGFDTAQIRVDREASTADIVLHYATGPRYKFGPITVEQDVLDPEYIEGYVLAEQGEPFEADLLRQSQVDLTTGPWFGRADIKVEKDEATADHEVPVRFVLSPAPPQRYEIAAGYGTDTGIRGSVGAKFRRLNSRAHNAEAEVRVSEIEMSVAGRYNIPAPFPSPSIYSVFGSFGDVSPSWSSTTVGTAGVSWAHSRGPFRETISLAWEGSSYTAAAQDGDASLVIPQIQWSWVEANDRIVATKGHRINVTLNGALDALLSSATFLTAQVDAKAIRPIGSRMRGIARAEVGYTLTDDIRDLPPTRRFVTGGDQSVRGYSYESLGPSRDGAFIVDDEPILDPLIGGKALLVGSLEADYEVIRGWRFAVFGDVGDAMADFSDVSLEFSAGAGIRWVSPIGMVRFDGAFRVSEPGAPFRVHFVLGPDL